MLCWGLPIATVKYSLKFRACANAKVKKPNNLNKTKTMRDARYYEVRAKLI